jgi:phenylacetate-CoA ligase
MLNLKDKIKKEFYEKIVYPVYHFKNDPAFGYKIIDILNQIDKSQWLSRDELIAYQSKKLKKLISHAYNNVPFYRKSMDKIGISIEDIKGVEDINCLPILTKNQIRENYRELLSTDLDGKKLIETSTGGSTGEPVRFVRDLNTLAWTDAAKIRAMSWAKYKISDTVIDYMTDGKATLLGSIRGRMINTYYFPAFAKEDEIAAKMKVVGRLKPFCLIGYSSNLYRIASICDKHKINDIEFKAIFSTGEMLYDYQRVFLGKTFNCKVFDYYGCNEVGTISYECEYHNKHITDERFIIEATDSKGTPGIETMGETTITDLDNYAMPFIRYKNGDVINITHNCCECGRRLKVIKSVDGRSQDFLRTLDGNYLPAIYFPNRFYNLKGIKQYQIIQTDIHNITLKIVKNQYFSIHELEEMTREIKVKLGDINVNLEEHHEIPLTREGKKRLVISHVPINF